MTVQYFTSRLEGKLQVIEADYVKFHQWDNNVEIVAPGETIEIPADCLDVIS